VPPDEPETEHHLVRRVDPTLLDAVYELLGGLWADEPHIPETDRMMFETAVTEIAGNIVGHGGVDVEMTLRLWARPDRVVARFEDNGRALSPDFVTAAEMPGDLDESGRGVALAKAAVDEVRYQREGEHNEWTLVRLLHRPEE